MGTLRLELDGDVLDFTNIDEGFAVPEWERAWPGVRTVRDPIPGRDGEADRTRNFGGRAVTMSGSLLPGSLTMRAALDRLHRFCHPGARPWLIFDEEDDGELRRIRLAADGQSAPIASPAHRAWSASWYAAGPFVEAVDAVEVNLSVPTGTAGLLLHATAIVLPVLLPATGGDEVDVVNPGSMAAAWVLNIYGPATDPVITNERTGEAIVFDGLVIPAGAYVEVDQGAMTALANSDPAANRFGFVDIPATRFWPIYPGHNPITFTCTSPGATTRAILATRATYL